MSAKTCCISGLTISSGTPVRIFLMTRSPYENRGGSNAVYPFHWWIPRTFPIKATYADYGRVEGPQEGLQQDLWFQGLALDMAPSAASRGAPTMSFEELQEALSTSGIAVQRKPCGGRTKAPAGVPTKKRVKECLVAAGLPIAAEHAGNGFTVHGKAFGNVCVRWRGANKGARSFWQAKAQAALGRYATAIVAGRSPSSSDLLVFPMPGTKGFSSAWSLPTKSSLPVHVGMVREDVWQALLRLPVADAWDSSDPETIDAFREDVRRIYAWALENGMDDARALSGEAASEEAAWAVEHKATSAEKALALKVLRRSQFSNMDFDRGRDPTTLSFMVGKDEVPSTTGLATHFQLFCGKGLPMGEAEPFLDAVAEFAFVSLVAMVTRHMWVPSSSAGPADGHVDAEAAYLSAMRGIAEKDAAGWHARHDDTLKAVQRAKETKAKHRGGKRKP